MFVVGVCRGFFFSIQDNVCKEKLAPLLGKVDLTKEDLWGNINFKGNVMESFL